MSTKVACRSERVNLNNKACNPVPTTVVYMQINSIMNHVEVYKQGSGDWCMWRSQMDRNIAQISLLFDDLLMSYQAFGVNLMWYFCSWRGLHVD